MAEPSGFFRDGADYLQDTQFLAVKTEVEEDVTRFPSMVTTPYPSGMGLLHSVNASQPVIRSFAGDNLA